MDFRPPPPLRALPRQVILPKLWYEQGHIPDQRYVLWKDARYNGEQYNAWDENLPIPGPPPPLAPTGIARPGQPVPDAPAEPIFGLSNPRVFPHSKDSGQTAIQVIGSDEKALHDRHERIKKQGRQTIQSKHKPLPKTFFGTSRTLPDPKVPLKLAEPTQKTEPPPPAPPPTPPAPAVLQLTEGAAPVILPPVTPPIVPKAPPPSVEGGGPTQSLEPQAVTGNVLMTRLHAAGFTIQRRPSNGHPPPR